MSGVLTLQNILTWENQGKEITTPLLTPSLLLKIFILANPFLKGNTKSPTNKYKVQNPTVLSLAPTCL